MHFTLHFNLNDYREIWWVVSRQIYTLMIRCGGDSDCMKLEHTQLI